MEDPDREDGNRRAAPGLDARPLSHTAGIAAALLGVIAACALFFWLIPPGSIRSSEGALRRPYARLHDNDFVGALDVPWWVLWNRPRLPDLSLHEDGRMLITVPIAERIGKDGRPRPEVVFHASDRSDPNQNGHSYTITYARPRVPLVVYLLAAAVAATAAFAFGALIAEVLLAGRPGLRRTALAMGSLLYAAILVEGTSGILLLDRLAGSATMRGMYDQMLHPESIPLQLANAANFTNHPYLNFVLNPAAARHRGQIDAHFRIRRSEPIRPRREVDWRALVLGGSTTFGELIADEKDTWVYRLEQKVRAARGPSYDVINGGVSGYTVVDNLLHYLLLLEELDPDVVVLYVGINDVHVRLTGDLQRDYSNSRLPWRGEKDAMPLRDPRLTWSPTYRYLLLRETERRRSGHIFQFIQQPSPPRRLWADALRRNGPQIYRDHLRDLVRLLTAQGRKVVVVPQVFLSRKKSDAFADAVMEHNAVNEAVAREFGLPFLGSLPSAFEKSDLFDDCHFNADGGEKLATLLFRFFERDWADAETDRPPENASK